MEEKRVYSFVDLAKFVFSFFVIMIHSNIFSDVNESLNYFTINIFTRIAVPFFFVVSGFFFVKPFDFNKQKKIKKTKSNFKRLRKTEWRIIVLYSVWSVIYVFAAMHFDYNGWSFVNIVDYCIASIIRYSFYHLWYVLALIYAYPIIYLMMRFFSRKVITVVCILMYATGAFVCYYSYIFSNSAIGAIGVKFDEFTLSSLISSVIFRAVPLMWLGVCVALKEHKPKKMFCLIAAFAAFGLLVAENVILNKLTNGFVKGNYIFSTLIVVYFLLMFAVQSKIKIKKETSTRLRNMSTLNYCLHAMIDQIFSRILFPDLNSVLMFVLIAVVTTVISAGIVILSEKKKFKFLKYLY